MTTKVSMYPDRLDRGAREVHVIGRVVSGTGHRILSLPTPYGLPPGIKDQLQTINLHLQHSGVVLERQRDWLRDRAELARQADAPALGTYVDAQKPLLSTDPNAAIDGFDRERVLAAGGVILGGGGLRIEASQIREDRHKGDDWLGDDDRAASNLDAVNDDAEGDAARLRALSEDHDRPLPSETTADGTRKLAPDSSEANPANEPRAATSGEDHRTVTSGETTSGGSLRGKGNGGR
jgi:hypothetical protein